jgi:hypothetical protein
MPEIQPGLERDVAYVRVGKESRPGELPGQDGITAILFMPRR